MSRYKKGVIYIYEWLNSLITLDNELFELKLSLTLNKKELSRWKNYTDSDGDLAKHQTFLTALAKQNHLQGVISHLNQRIRELEEEREDIVTMIDKFNGLNQRILKMKYVEGLTLESIADELGYNYQYIKNKHAEIMRMIRFKNSK